MGVRALTLLLAHLATTALGAYTVHQAAERPSSRHNALMKVPGVEALREALAALGLDTRGHKDKLKKRLRTATKALQPDGDDVVDDVTEDVVSQRKLPLLKPDGQDFHSYLVLDFEATCQRHEPAHGHFLGFPNEVRCAALFKHKHCFASAYTFYYATDHRVPSGAVAVAKEGPTRQRAKDLGHVLDILGFSREQHIFFFFRRPFVRRRCRTSIQRRCAFEGRRQ